MKNNSTLLNVKEAAKFLGISESTLCSWCNKKLIPFLEYPGPIRPIRRFSAERLAEWQATREIIPANMEAEKAIRKARIKDAEYSAMNRDAIRRLANDHGIIVRKPK